MGKVSQRGRGLRPLVLGQLEIWAGGGRPEGKAPLTPKLPSQDARSAALHTVLF